VDPRRGRRKLDTRKVDGYAKALTRMG
jgi:hypothetical protein